jgi:DNA-binding beta-propeller fold protein YncE
MRKLVFVLAVMLASGAALAAGGQTDPLVSSGALDRLMADSGVWHKAPGTTTPQFVVDPSWPRLLPHHWLLGQIGGLFVDRHDHIWVLNRPRSLTNDESGLEPAVTGALDSKKVAVSGLGFERPHGPGADCCISAPSVLEFDSAGKLLRAWGGPSDPGWMEKHCRAEAGCIWPGNEHGIYVDAHDDIWIGGNTAYGGAPPEEGGTPAAGTGPRAPWATNKYGADGFLLKFDMAGNFKMRVGGTPKAFASNDKDGGINGTPAFYQPADIVVDPQTNRLYVADGYGNRRIVIADAGTGKYIGHFGAYGNNPVDDAAAKAAGRWPDDLAAGRTKPMFFRNPVHCVKIADDGKIYVCDRGNDRIQVFDKNSPELGKPCNNPDGVVGKCGYLGEQKISAHTETLPVMPGTAVSMSFSKDKGQSCLYVGDNTNQTLYILNRQNLTELGRLGTEGRMAGQFHWLHQVGLDSQGNIYTAEVDTGKRIQKFLRYGAAGCTGTGFATVGGIAEH